MNRVFTFLLLCFHSVLLAQLPIKHVFVGNSGVFEFAPPFTDRVTLGMFNAVDGSYRVVDTIRTESVQRLVVDGESLFVLAQDSIVKYNAWSGKRLASAAFLGGSPLNATADNQFLYVGKWYGGIDSFLHIYQKNTLQLQSVVAAIQKEVKGLLVWGDTLFISQNIPGSVDQCPPFGCFSDSIGQLGVFQRSTQSYLGTISLDSAAGISQLYAYQGNLVAVCASAAKIAVINPQTFNAVYHDVAGDLGQGLGLRSSELHLMLNGQPATYDLSTQTLVSSGNSPLSYPAATALDPDSNVYYQTVTDYSTFGKFFRVAGSSFRDSLPVGISSEALAVFSGVGNVPVANRDEASTDYTLDTLVNVLLNDTDADALPLELSLISAPIIPGASASVESGTSIRYTPAIGLIGLDSVQYRICDQTGFCDSAWLVVNVTYFASVHESGLEAVRVYPNPTTGRIQWDDELEVAAAVLYTIQGMKVQLDLDSANHSMNLENLPAGIYRLMLTDVFGKTYLASIYKK